MSQDRYSPRSPSILKDREEYQALYERSITKQDEFWEEMALNELHWFHPFHQVRDNDWNHGLVSWFLGGKLNACDTCVDRHLAH